MGRKPTDDPNLFAKRVFDNLLTKLDPDAVPEAQPDSVGKDPLAIKAGRVGGPKGGRMRAQNLSPRKRSQIARKAAKARWNKKDE